MNAKLFPLLLGVALGAGRILLPAQDASSHGAKQAATRESKVHATTHANSGQEDGERVFAQHCSRCHNAPQSFSPRVAGTIVRHMRVRANLTPEEERAVLHFFNP